MRCPWLLLSAAGAALSAFTCANAQTTPSSTTSTNAAATLSRKDLGAGNLPADQVVINPKCAAVEISVREDVGVRVVCRDPGTSITPFTSVVGQYVEVRNRQGSKVTVAPCDDVGLRFLVFANHDDYIAKAQISIDPTSFSGLTSLNALIFDNINLEKPQLQVTIPAGLGRLEVVSTNVLGLSLRASGTPSISTFNFRDTAMTALPAALYERQYKSKLQINNLKVSPLEDVQQLNATQYANAIANLNTTALAQASNVDFVGDCSDATKAASGRLAVCRSSNPRTTKPDTGSSKATASPFSSAPTTSPPGPPSTTNTGLIIGLVCAALVLAALAWFFIRRRNARRAQKQAMEEETLTFVNGDGTLSPTSSATWEARTTTLSAPDVAPLRVPMADLVLGSEISQGAFGRVYRGSFQGEKVAVKRLAPHRRKDLKQFLSFVDEAKLMAFSSGADPAVVSLARECMAMAPADRPSAAVVAERMLQLCRK
ncbi:hypothetical protein ATCC90586_009631 [Pythium insidiosum]|nr:hypothetical protein ATCC90586_009631 [Pythium insidiosum]